MDHVIVIHGWKSRPETNWKPWLKKELEDRGIRVDVPAMPDPMTPDVSDWVNKIKETVGKPTNRTYLVGHSLGGIAILKYLETLGQDEIVGATILLASFGQKFDGYKGQHPSFFEVGLDWERIRRQCHKFVAIASDDDANIKLDQLQLFKDELGAKGIVLHGMGHFASDDGVFEVPIVRDELLSIIGREIVQ